MAGLLDPEELEALMAEEQSSQSSGKYNLARQDYAVQRLIPTLSLIQSQFASAASTRLREFVSSVEGLTTDRITVMKFDELQGTLPAPCSISLISGMPLSSNLMIAFESELVFNLVDRYFGGYGGAADAAREQFSASELSFMDILVSALLPDIALAWKSVMKIAPAIESQSTDPRLLEGFTEADSLVATRFLVDIGDFKGGLWSVVPWSAIDAVRDSLPDTTKPSNKKPASEEWRSRLVERIDEVPLDLVAQLAKTRLSLSRVANLRRGDVIPLPSADEVLLCVGEQPLLKGRFGSHQGQLAVQLTGAAGRSRPKQES